MARTRAQGGARGGRGGRGGRRGGRAGGRGEGPENPDLATILGEALNALMPTLLERVTNALAGGSGDGGDNRGDGGDHGDANGNENENENGGDGEDRELNNGGNGGGNTKVVTYRDFTFCKPIDFDGLGGATAYVQWMEKMEAVITLSGCAPDQRVNYVSGSLVGKALTWWNSEISTRGREAAMAMPWDMFKTLMHNKFCPEHELERLQLEFTNQTMVGADFDGYTNRFHELARLVPHMVTPEPERIRKYIRGLEKEVQVLVSSTAPKTFEDAVERAGRTTEDLVRNGIITRGGEKRKNDNEAGSSKRGGRFDNKRQRRGGKVFAATEPEKKGYVGQYPMCGKCNRHHPTHIQCGACYRCNQMGHRAKECRVNIDAGAPLNVAPIAMRNPRGRGACFECGSPDHYKNACPRWVGQQVQVAVHPNQLQIVGPNQNRGQQQQPQQQHQRGGAFAINAAEARNEPNVVAGTFLLNGHLATILFDSGADFSP